MTTHCQNDTPCKMAGRSCSAPLRHVASGEGEEALLIASKSMLVFRCEGEKRPGLTHQQPSFGESAKYLFIFEHIFLVKKSSRSSHRHDISVPKRTSLRRVRFRNPRLRSLVLFGMGSTWKTFGCWACGPASPLTCQRRVSVCASQDVFHNSLQDQRLPLKR